MRIARKYVEGEEAAPTVSDNKDNGPVARTRRALVDITNNIQTSITHGLTKDTGAKRQQVQQQPVAPVSIEPSMSIALAADDVHVDMDTNRFANDPRVYMQRDIDDIDSRDNGNPLLCCTYVNDMYVFFAAAEKEMMINPKYMEAHQHINEKMRCILVDWLVEVHLKFKMVPETLYLAINLIDRYLEKVQVRRSMLQRVGVAALLVIIYTTSLNINKICLFLFHSVGVQIRRDLSARTSRSCVHYGSCLHAEGNSGE